MAQDTLEEQKELFNYQSPASKENQERRSSNSKEKVSVRISIDLLLALVLFILVSGIFIYLFGVHQGKKSAQVSQTTSLNSASLESLEQSETPTESTAAQTTSANASNSQISNVSNATVEQTQEEVTPAPQATRAAQTAPVTTTPAEVTAPTVTAVNPWTIQLITYVGQVKGTDEVKKLKTKGFQAFIIPSGKYSQVCVGKFNTKSEAERFLAQTQSLKIYSGAVVRRVKRS